MIGDHLEGATYGPACTPEGRWFGEDMDNKRFMHKIKEFFFFCLRASVAIISVWIFTALSMKPIMALAKSSPSVVISSIILLGFFLALGILIFIYSEQVDSLWGKVTYLAFIKATLELTLFLFLSFAIVDLCQPSVSQFPDIPPPVWGAIGATVAWLYTQAREALKNKRERRRNKAMKRLLEIISIYKRIPQASVFEAFLSDGHPGFGPEDPPIKWNEQTKISIEDAIADLLKAKQIGLEEGSYFVEGKNRDSRPEYGQQAHEGPRLLKASE